MLGILLCAATLETGTLEPGLRVTCEATLVGTPRVTNMIVCRRYEYMLRYDVDAKHATSNFDFYVWLDGAWEPHASVPCAMILGRTYRLDAAWDGIRASLAVDGAKPVVQARTGISSPVGAAISTGSAAIRARLLAVTNVPTDAVTVDLIRTRELLPRRGAPFSVLGTLTNAGRALDGLSLVTTISPGARVTLLPPNPCPLTPTPYSLTHTPFSLPARHRQDLVWQVDPGTNDFVELRVEARRGARRLALARHRFTVMPATDPDFASPDFTPPVKPSRTHYIDARDGNDANDGTSPQTAWKSFHPINGKTLGPGERLLLRRGSVFREELVLRARASVSNWAEIAAYGEGCAPIIRRTRDIGEKCVFLQDPACLVVRDLIVCDAGAGLIAACHNPAAGNLLVERGLAHHIEGVYRFNAHGIPEWRNRRGPSETLRSPGFAAMGKEAKRVLFRDLETYQCTSGFYVQGHDNAICRVYCHDSFAPNASPHPYLLSNRSWMTDCVLEASGFQASAGTMGLMLANNCGLVIRGCHFLDMPNSGSPDQGGIDFESDGENCLVDACTFRRNAGAAIEVLGLSRPQTRNVWIRGCRFDRNNWARKNGPCEVQVYGSPKTPPRVACSNGRLESNAFVTLPDIPFYVNDTTCSNDWSLVHNRRFDFAAEMDRALPLGDPPTIALGDEIWSSSPDIALEARLAGEGAILRWEQIEGECGVRFQNPTNATTRATFPAVGDYRIRLIADNGRLWRSARQTIHILPRATRLVRAWNFARNLDTEGWRAEETGCRYEKFADTHSFPVRSVFGDYFVLALTNATAAALVSDDTQEVCQNNNRGPFTLRIRLQNHTTARRMVVKCLTREPTGWESAPSVSFAVTPHDTEDRLYVVPLPDTRGIRQLRLAFAVDGPPISGTCRVDYLALTHELNL